VRPTLVAMATKFGLKSAITRLVWHIDRRCLHLPGGFRGWPIQWKHAKCCGADRSCHGNDIWARRGVQSPTGLFSCRFVAISTTVRSELQHLSASC